MNSQLTVYKASAGSGKTFTLAKVYMSMVISNPASYRSILAVTFTNKATEEMKTRIISQLYGIAHHLPESGEYLKQIKETLPHLSEKQIEENAGLALKLLIHNYHYFRVQTIDTFFQSVLRNLARELDLTANLRIGLNDLQVEQQAVDELIESLSDTDRLLFWIMDYIKENMAEDKGWNVIGQIKKFGENIFKDYYKDHAEQLETCLEKEGFFKEYTDKMKSVSRKAKEHLEEVAISFFDALGENGYSADDLAGKQRGIWSYFNKLKNGKFDNEDLINATFAKCYESPEAWVKKSEVKSSSALYTCVATTLYPILRYAEECRPKLNRLYKSAELTRKHLNQLRLLGSINKKVREMNNDANRFLLSDTQTLLHSLIQENDSPFIFEKIGSTLEHVMIDEFQDTSTIQWKNFKVLLQETMSHQDAGNLIVGDVKQSIYRWRSGDWRLLNNIEKEFSQHSEIIDIQQLDTNYRSCSNIIDFNNKFFKVVADREYKTLKDNNPEEALQLKNAYADVAQLVPESKPQTGWVKIQLIGQQDYQEKMMELTLDAVNDLVEKGIDLSQIAILVRNNKTIQDIAEYIMAHSDYPLVSDEAFRLDASQAVNTLITALHYLQHPNDEIDKATLIKFCILFLQDTEVITTLMEDREKLLQMPLFDLVEQLYCLFQLGEIKEMTQQSAYICAFYDQLSNFLSDNSSDIESFLQEWDNTMHCKSIHSDSISGIRLITIHKSKGLEFDHVIMPFCDWTLEKGNTIWCTPTEEPFCELPLVPIDFGAKQMKNSIYEEDYNHEHLQNVVDNLNLLYVAFTRASKSLFVFARRGSATLRSSIIEDSIEEVQSLLAETEQPCELDGIGSDKKTEDIYFEYGSFEHLEEKKREKKTSQNVFSRPSIPLPIDYTVTTKLPEFRQSNQSRDFVEGDEQEEQQKYYIKMGTVLHRLFSTIHTKDDIEGALKQLEIEGILYDDNVSRERIEKMMRKRLESPRVSDWFSERWTIFNECSILTMIDGKMTVRRPDRVMKDDNEMIVVDFKFGKPREEYISQVKQYMELLSAMGYNHVKGYLWYVYPNQIEEVK